MHVIFEVVIVRFFFLIVPIRRDREPQISYIFVELERFAGFIC
jgi:hypothetical protein